MPGAGVHRQTVEFKPALIGRRSSPSLTSSLLSRHPLVCRLQHVSTVKQLYTAPRVTHAAGRLSSLLIGFEVQPKSLMLCIAKDYYAVAHERTSLSTMAMAALRAARRFSSLHRRDDKCAASRTTCSVT